MPDVTKDFPPKKRPYTYREDEYWFWTMILAIGGLIIVTALV